MIIERDEGLVKARRKIFFVLIMRLPDVEGAESGEDILIDTAVWQIEHTTMGLATHATSSLSVLSGPAFFCQEDDDIGPVV